MNDTVRGFGAQVYEYVKGDIVGDYLHIASYDSEALERNAEEMASRMDLANDHQKRRDAMRMMEETGVLPMLLLKKRDSLDLDDDGDLRKEELEAVMQDQNSSVLELVSAEYAMSNFDEIRDGWNIFDWYENLETGEILSHAEDARRSPDKDPEDIFYGEVTAAPAIGADEEGEKKRNA